MTRMTMEQRAQFYATPEWKALRERIVLRDGAQCRNCGHPEVLEVHRHLPVVVVVVVLPVAVLCLPLRLT